VQRAAHMKHSAPDPKTVAHVVTTKSILIFCPKGGVGKTTLARTIAVAASLENRRVLALDYDASQGTFTKWHNKRRNTDLSKSDFDCKAGEWDNWRGIWNDAQSYDLVVIDSPPDIRDRELQIREMSKAADLILIPTGVSEDDTDIAVSWMRHFREERNMRNVKFVLSRLISPKRNTVTEAKGRLMDAGPILGTHLQLWDEISYCNDIGISALENRKSKPGRELALLWNEIKHEIDL